MKLTIVLGVAAALAAGALAGCGGSSSSKTTSTTQQARLTPNQSNPDVGAATASQSTSAGDGSQTTTTGVHPAHRGSGHAGGAIPGRSTHRGPQKARPGPDDASENNPTLDHLPNPCRLVSASQARSILKAPIARPIEAPLGPTCIYQPKANKAEVTLSVQSVGFAQATRQLAHRQSVALQGHQGVCGKLGAQMLYVSLGGGEVLSVAGPCNVAVRFATIAIARLGA